MQKIRLLLTSGTKGSQSAKRLAQALTQKLGYKIFRSTLKKPGRTHLAYGQGVDKIAQYKFFKDNNIPALEFTTEESQVAVWLNEGNVVFGRQFLNSSCGKGIIVVDPKELPVGPLNLPNVPVWTKYKKKKREFRVHVFKDQVVRVVEKKLRKDWNGPRDSKVRNLANGYVFCSCEDVPSGLCELAIKAAGAVSSDFKGVDVGFNEKLKELFVIEVNSAPGIEGSNIEAYVNAIAASGK